ncbi:hypothetical protein QRX60_43500 [Amycolatopsis mongoliensis]|uniref:Uncharacterized protein n=1 Tax=Amycolatopsis mongoliensis TaxID=715475 RepID=A0A9Y2JNB3_9PSEU|nr:hypothetical protein [Amycolatopsis sp. 4-36]WIY00850.1 hypothetical protein QRX60_43500 [Amycolatopsis sp. 4-36]
MLDVLRTGRIGTAAVLLSLAVALAALPSATAVRLGLRAGIDAVARLLFLPSHAWSAAVLLVDVVLIAAAWHTAGRAGRRAGER